MTLLSASVFGFQYLGPAQSGKVPGESAVSPSACHFGFLQTTATWEIAAINSSTSHYRINLRLQRQQTLVSPYITSPHSPREASSRAYFTLRGAGVSRISSQQLIEKLVVRPYDSDKLCLDGIDPLMRLQASGTSPCR